ncbi:MAG: EAL domain-containing protein [Alphaproteobacteria bacterium]
MPPKTPERYGYRILVDRVDRLRNARDGYNLVVLDFRQTPFASSLMRTTMAMHLVEHGFRERDGETHRIGDWFLTCITETRTAPLLKELIQTVLALSTEWDHVSNDDPFVTNIEIKKHPRRVEAAIALMDGVLTAAEKAKAAEEDAERRKAAASRGQAKEISDPGHFSPVVQLEFIESQLPRLRFAELMRAQPICKVKNGAITAFLGQELYTSIADLQKRFSTSIDIVEHYLLRHHLTQQLDQLLIAQFDDGRLLSDAVAVHINILLSSLRTPAFHRFDAMMTERRRTVTLEINMTDALAHIGDYRSMVPTLRKRGYFVALDGVSTSSLDSVEIERLPADMVKLTWQNDMPMTEQARRRLNTIRERKIRLILCRCDRKAAFGWGDDEGVEFFQGVAVDAMAATALAGACTTAASLDCTVDKCRTMHWAVNQARLSRCPRTMWIVRPTTAAAAAGSAAAAGRASPSAARPDTTPGKP